TDAGGQFYNLMEKQSASLTGQISNLQDAWDTVLNDFGKSGEGLFSAAISGATFFVEHMDDVLRIVKSLTIAYGTYKAAMVLTSVAMKGHTGIAVIDNTIRSAKLAILKGEVVVNGKLLAQETELTRSEVGYYAALEATLTAEEKANVVKTLRIGAIQSVLTAQQQEYISTLGLTTADADYERVALSVMTTDQKKALSKKELTTTSAAYRAAIAQEATAKKANQATSLESMRLTVKEAAAKAEATRMDALKAKSALEAAQMELHRAQTTAGVEAYVVAQKKLEAAEENAALTRKAALAAQSDFYAKKKALEAAATQQAKNASVADTAAKTAQAATTNILSVATAKLTTMFKGLWAALKANPFGWLITIVGMAYSLFTMFSSKTEETSDTMSEFGDETKKVTDRLQLYFSILQNTEKETKSHKDALEKINQICQEYNKTLLDENATLDIQTLKYQELKKAIEESTAAKIIAKKTEEANTTLSSTNDKNYERWNKWTEGATYWKATNEDGSSGYQSAAKNIRNMSDEVKEATRALVEESASELAKLSGKNFDKEFTARLNRITAAIQASADISEAEMPTVRRQIDQYLKYSIRGYKEMNETVENSKKTLKAYYDAAATPPDTTATDYSKMSFEDLDKLVLETQKEIDEINAKKVKVDTDNTKLNELLAKLKEIKGVIDTKTTDLNTEEGISKRIKQLKDERAQTKINSDRYKELNKEIAKLEGRMPKHTNAQQEAKQRERNAETLRQKQLDADRRLEEARISTLEEGYEKRKAMLDLQLKDELNRIEKEKRELIKARKEAGEGGLSAKENEDFEKRKTYATQNYDRDSAKLFEEELDYKRKQYELYWRWVANMGSDVANKQFSNLLKSGNSYKDYIEKQMAELSAKEADGTLTKGEQNFLFQLRVQYDDLTGAKSALEQFKQTVAENIDKTTTLAEKLEVLARAKQTLENGKSGLNEDDRTAAALEIERQRINTEKEVQRTLLTDYRTYEEQKKSIADQYRLLREAAEKEGNTERVALINRGEQEALSALNTSFLQQSESWKRLFSDLDTLSVGQIQKLVGDIEAQVNSGNLQLSPVDMQAVIDSLNRARNQILELNPFKALDTYFDNYIKAKQKLAEAKAKLAEGKGTQKDVDDAQSEVKTAANGITAAVEKVTDITTECGQSLQS
ncbi:MAG: hypothetical protein NC548_60600, partial [Lachnospiraceae bacterium]|nr:hypothetical protein [Lachnospiraceae bacterium]